MTDLFPGDPASDDANANPAQSPPGSSSSPKPRPSTWSRVWPKAAVATALVAVLGLAGALAYVGSVNHAIEKNLQQAENLPSNYPQNPTESPRPPKSSSDEVAVNYLIIGSDSRTTDVGEGSSDLMMVLHLDADRGGASLMSFSQDMYIPIPGHGKNRINTAYATGGAPLAVRTVEGLLDVRMDHVAVIDFSGFIGLVDQLGGITVDNPYPSTTTSYSFPAGKISLRGDKALAYVRDIEELPGGDSSRAERQRLVMTAMVSKMLSKDVLLNPAKFTRFMGSAARQVTVDQDTTPAELRKTAMSIRFNPEDLNSIQVPSRRGDGDQINDLKTALQDDTMAGYVARYPVG